MANFTKGGYSDEGKISKYNPAWLKMDRLHNINDTINRCWLNPLAYNQNLQQFNFEIILSCIFRLYQESQAKFNERERKKILAMGKGIELTLQKNPVYEQRTRKTMPHTKYVEINHGNWKVIKKWIDIYESEVKRVVDLHGLDTPNQEEIIY